MSRAPVRFVLAAVALAPCAACSSQQGGRETVTQEPTVPKEQKQQDRGQERRPNRLAKETSPYLRQHQFNPVDWYPWGEEAFAKAKKEDKPVFLSIGYAACHWCHVMEHESFENDAIAAVLNAHFVPVKVDREERPDLDEIHMLAVQSMGVPGGWPMSVWLTPEGKPFFGGTYFPPEDLHGRPGFKRVLEHLAAAWKDKRKEVLAGSDELGEHLRKALAPVAQPGEPDAEILERLLEQSSEHYDSVHGGFGPGPHYAPKFPHSSELQVLLRLAGSDAKANVIATHTLDRMLAGGMYDQLAGGFHRYSTDREWLVPHFEKMLYDNALLVPCYLDAFLLTGNVEYARIARETLDYLLREMRHERGGFWSSQDADSEGVEGKFFVWSKAEVDAVLGEEAPLACARWGITAEGNWEGTNVLHLAQSVEKVAAAAKRPADGVELALAAARGKLLAAREKRVHPGTDDKVLCAWNGLAIHACAVGHQVLGDAKYLDAARAAASFVLEELVVDGRCLRSWHSGKAQHKGYLEDHVQLADALLTLFETDADPRWLRSAKSLLDATAEHFRDDEDGNFFFTADDHEKLIARSKSAAEASTPTGIAVAARAFLRAGLLLGDEKRYAIGTGVLRANHALLQRVPAGCPSLTLAAQFWLAEPREIVIAGEPSDARTQALVKAVRERFPAFHVTALVHSGNRAELTKLSPVFAGREPVGGAPAAYVCRRGVCEKPVTDPAELFAGDGPRGGAGAERK